MHFYKKTAKVLFVFGLTFLIALTLVTTIHSETKANSKHSSVISSDNVFEAQTEKANNRVSESHLAVKEVAPVAYTFSGVLSNGNTAGEIGRYAAQKMEAATGVSASTWEYIIARESNGQADVQNASGAAGLFQTMPGWGSTATVDDQIQSAINAYNAQGLSAWGY